MNVTSEQLKTFLRKHGKAIEAVSRYYSEDKVVIAMLMVDFVAKTPFSIENTIKGLKDVYYEGTPLENASECLELFEEVVSSGVRPEGVGREVKIALKNTAL